MTPETGKHRLADDLGLPVARLNSAMWWLEWKAAAIDRIDGRWLYMEERRLAARVDVLLKKQMAYMVDALKDIVPPEGKGIRYIEKKALNDELKRIMDNMPYEAEIVASVKRSAILGLLKGGSRVGRDLKLAKFGIRFDVKHPDAVKYLSGLEDLNLSQRYGSINYTTRRNIIDIVTEGVQTGDSYTSLAKKIQEQGKAGVFSKARAETIAAHQMASAYEEGKAIVAEEAEQTVGDMVLSSWQTVNDDRVTEECRRNQQAGWLPRGTPFPSGHVRPPRFPRCRCAERYDFASNIRLKGGLTPDTEREVARAQAKRKKERPLETAVQAMNGQGASVSVPVADGHVYHATPARNIESIAAQGLLPKLSQLDKDEGGTTPRVYLGTNPAVTGTGLEMVRDGDIMVRVRADVLKEAGLDPHIPNELSLFVTHGIKPEDIEVQDEFGRWVALLEFVKALSTAS